MMYSDCCGSEPSFMSEDICGECFEWAEFADFEDDVEDENLELTSEELKELMKIYYK
tara:strand:+ start:475 stop:645 length:171 start_codon:yes stop_codon:yes gene_type:complete